MNRSIREAPLSHRHDACARDLSAVSCLSPRISNRFAFTIIELLVVISIIIILAGLVLTTIGYAQKKGARSRAQTEIFALSAAIESYRVDNGIYPTKPGFTENVDPATADVATMQKASLYLYGELSGDTADTLQPPAAGVKSYFKFTPQMLSGTKDPNTGSLLSVSYIRDPFGNSYGYSTLRAVNPAGNAGFNPTFDLWSTANAAPITDQNQWIKNW